MSLITLQYVHVSGDVEVNQSDRSTDREQGSQWDR